VSAAVAQPSDTAGPSLFTAIQEQLGLKFELAKGPVEVIVIGSVQKPGSDVRHRMLRRCNIARLALSARRCAEIFARHHLTGAQYLLLVWTLTRDGALNLSLSPRHLPSLFLFDGMYPMTHSFLRISEILAQMSSSF